MSKSNNHRKLFQVVNAEDENEKDVYLYGTIREVPLPEEREEEVIILSDVKDQLSSINTGKINCHINSLGGDLFAGVAISNLLRNHNAEIETIIDGVAASAGSVIYMAGDTKKMHKNSSLLIHRVMTVVFGNAEDLEKTAEQLRQLDKSMKENYKDFFTGSDKELEELLKEDRYLTAEEAVNFGFCDLLVDEGNKTKTAGSGEISNKNNSLKSEIKRNKKLVAEKQKIFKSGEGSENNIKKNRKFFAAMLDEQEKIIMEMINNAR